MKELVTFHGHEIESAKIIESRLTKLGFSQIEITFPRILVESHQIRFYDNTQITTYRAFLRKLGKRRLSVFFAVLRADRAGNRMNNEKPITTHYMRTLEEKLSSIQNTTVFDEDLCISRWQLLSMNVPKEKIPDAINNMVAIVQKRPDRNNLLFLTTFIQKNYLEKKDERFKGLPDW